MAKLAAIGRRHFVGVFAAVGAQTVRCQTPAEFAEAAPRLLAAEAPQLVVLDQHFADCREPIEWLRKRGVVVLLLGAERSEGHPALDAIRQLIEVAAGANILGEY
jgi:vacuolar-type H+-ATPase subunit F/Vma7